MGDRRRRGGRRRLANPTRVFAALDEMDFDARRLVDPDGAVIVEIALLHAALRHRDVAEQGCGHPEDQPALHLRDHAVRIDDDAAIARSEAHTSELQSIMRISYADI